MPRYPEGGHWRQTEDPRFSNRHVYCQIVNETKHTWYWEDFRLQEYSNFGFTGHNGWRQVKREIQPGESTLLKMISDPPHRGVEVWVTYNTGAGPLEFHWKNPNVGSNSYDTFKLPAEFISIHNSEPGRDTEPEIKLNRTIDGARPYFQWTIKQRDRLGALILGQKMRDHLYTIDPNGENCSQFGYQYNGPCGYVYPSQYPLTVPLYRFYNVGTGDHFYTRSANAEGNTSDWELEKIACWLPSTGVNGTSVLYRWFGHGNHFYTLDPNGEAAVAQGYTKEGDAGFVYSTQVHGTVPLNRWYFQRD